jgi:hypothetical protein
MPQRGHCPECSRDETGWEAVPDALRGVQPVAAEWASVKRLAAQPIAEPPRAHAPLPESGAADPHVDAGAMTSENERVMAS